MNEALKRNNTIGCCGIDCGLCPRFYTKGDSVCPGCGGPDFKNKHPSCGFLSCCVIKNGFEVCSDCPDYPCKRFDAERQGYDSFVVHRKIFANLDLIKDKGIGFFIDQQKIRMDILQDFLSNYDDGRSKSFFCISCALLPLDRLIQTQKHFKISYNSLPVREKNKLIKDYLLLIADKLGVVLRLKSKP